VVGDPEQVGNALRTAKARGDLVRCGPPIVLPNRQVSVEVELWEPVVRPSLVQRVGKRNLALFGGGLAACVPVAWLVVTWVLAHLTAVVLAVVIAGVGAAWLRLRVRRARPAVGGGGGVGHCPGCPCTGCGHQGGSR
jgi:hypothetical protein